MPRWQKLQDTFASPKHPYVNGVKQMSFSTVYRWFEKFSSGHESVKDAPYSERPRSAVTKFNINKIIVQKDARFTVRELAPMTNLG